MNNECMCCGEKIKEVSPDVELCMSCYDDVVVPEEYQIDWEMIDGVLPIEEEPDTRTYDGVIGVR